MYTNTISNRKKIIISILIIFLIGIIILGISLLSEKKVYNVYNEREYDYHEVIYNNEKYICCVRLWHCGSAETVLNLPPGQKAGDSGTALLRISGRYAGGCQFS